MDHLSIFSVSFAIAFLGAIAPGPLLTTVISESARQGGKSGPIIVLGHGLLEMAMVVLIIFGIAQYLKDPVIMRAITITGAAVLFYLGISMIVSAPKLTLDLGRRHNGRGSLVLTGIVMSATNPYFTIWWLTIGMGLLLGAKKTGVLAVAAFFSGHILADLVWYGAVSFMISRGRTYLSERTYRILIAGCGTVLIGFGIYFLV